MWKDAVQRLEQFRREALAGGGAEKIEEQHRKGKYTARERIDMLLDPGTFVEVDQLMESREADFDAAQKRYSGDGVVIGYGTINGRTVCVSSEDFTVIGGTLGETHSLKISFLQDLAYKMRVPLILISDSAGARIGEGVCSLNGYSRIFLKNTKASGVIPQLAVILGPCSGGACYCAALCDFIFTVRRTGKLFLTGPKVVEAVIGERVTAEDLGGAKIHEEISGVTHFSYDTEQECMGGVKRLLSYLPQNCEAGNEDLPRAPFYDRTGELYEIVPDNPRKPYDIHFVIERITDEGAFMEIQESFARNLVIGFARLEGQCIGIIANQPSVMGGALDCDASDKMARFIRFCDCFRIPLLTLVDVTAFLPGKDQEQRGLIRHGAKIVYAYAESTVPKITLILRKAFGGAYIAMNSKNIGADFVFAWPIAQIAVMGTEGAASILQKQSEDDFTDPFIAAKRGYVDEIIKPEETRGRLATAFQLLKTNKAEKTRNGHGNIPL